MKVAVAQVGAVLFDTSATMRRIEECCRQASLGRAQLLVFPEALIGGCPKRPRLRFASMGSRTEEGRGSLLPKIFRPAIRVHPVGRPRCSPHGLLS